MTAPKSKSVVGYLIAVVLAAAIAVGLIAVFGIDWAGDSGSGLSDSFKYDLQKYMKIDASLFHFHPVANIAVELQNPAAIAIGTDDQILVAGNKTLLVCSALPSSEGQGAVAAATQNDHAADVGQKLQVIKQISFDAEPHCVAVGNAEHAFPGRIYVGFVDHLEVFAPDGARVAVWPKLGFVTSVAVAEKDVFVADARAKVVWRYDAEGKQTGQIWRRADAGNTSGFVVPSPYFSVAMSPDGLLRVANPGAHRIEAYTLDGQLELSWGTEGNDVKSFCGCCNPSHIAVLPDGRIVTSEKGIPRVKVYSATGEFVSAVVGPDTLVSHPAATVETRDELRLRPVDVAADSHGRIYVLDSAARCVRVFAENEP
jgi:hypothetical protein